MTQEEKKAYLDVEVMIFDTDKPTKRISIPVDCSRIGKFGDFGKRISVMNTPAVKMWMVGSMKVDEDSPPAASITTDEFEQWLLDQAREAAEGQLEHAQSDETKDQVATILYRLLLKRYNEVYEKYKSIKR